jgi:hypothetical protein
MSGPAPLGGFSELAYVTNDLDAALALFRRCYGAAAWMETGVATIDLGNGRSARLRIAVGFIGQLLFELIEPVDGEVEWFRAVLPPGGALAIRPHHLGFVLPSIEALQERRAALAGTHDIAFHGAFGSSSHYLFADARQRLGLWLEYIRFGAEFEDLIPANDPTPIGEPAGRLARICQLAWVTNDYDRALAILRDDYRIERFLETGLVEADLGRGRMARLKVALAYVGEMQFELIAPIDGAIGTHRIGLPDDGRFTVAFHHIGMSCPNRETLDAQRAVARAQDDDIPIEGEFGNSAFFYADARERIGHHLEYIHFDPAYDALIPRN